MTDGQARDGYSRIPDTDCGQLAIFREHSGGQAGKRVDARPRYWGVSSREQHGPIPLMTHMLLGEGELNWCRTPEGMINGRLMG